MAPYPVFASKWIALRDAAGWVTKAMEAEGFTQFSERTRRDTPFDHRALFKWQKGTGRPTDRQLVQLATKLEKAGYAPPAAARIVDLLMNEEFQSGPFCQELERCAQPSPAAREAGFDQPPTNPNATRWEDPTGIIGILREQKAETEKRERILTFLDTPEGQKAEAEFRAKHSPYLAKELQEKGQALEFLKREGLL